ncbi:starch-binding outer membrane lipoprotein SusD [Hoylesella oralis]|uniref:starch-binding outer membrane lipoprotein SusD n=1 Tax=Hoylesella oralis TaxID=28134 RepID=UPI0028E6E033|nr:starch-binding outer membrane lipoprotein SusD [Hoylesella oralis]
MRHIFVKTAIAGLLALGMASCADDLNISSIDPQTSPSFEDMSLLAKVYGTLGVTGQKGATGAGDISSDEGESGFYRTTFNLQTLPTDECNWAWQTDQDIPQITGISWNSTSVRTQWAYQRLGYDITLCNFYLQETAGKAEDANYKYYRAEVRFLRALHYWYFLDLWHKAPFKDEKSSMTEKPVEKAGKDLYDWIDNELTEIESQLSTIGSFNDSKNYGRVDQGAAYMLHARLALNAPVYTNGVTKAYDKAIEYCDKIINSGAYKLSNVPKTNPTNGLTYSGYAQLFMADNDENTDAMKEIILPIRQDGEKTRSFSGATYLISSTRITGMPYAGTTNCWSCNYARPNLIEKFFPNDDIPMSTVKAPDNLTEAEIIALDAQDGSDTKSIIAAAGDDRALFYAGRGGGIRKLRTDKLNNFLDGISVVKFQNIRTDGKTVHDKEFPDMDIPLIRYAEAFMTRAEAKWRKGDMTAISDVNVLRARANATPLTQLTEQDLIDEWSREFYMEGRRRSDLIRFDMFTGKKYNWAWKGGVPNGQAVDSHFKYYPIPLDDINNNENMHQNADY